MSGTLYDNIESSSFKKSCKNRIQTCKETTKKTKLITHGMSKNNILLKYTVMHILYIWSNYFQSSLAEGNEDCIVLFSFGAFNKDEVTLEAGSLVSVIEKTSSGWSWASERMGEQTGWFPSNYLATLDNSLKKDENREVKGRCILVILFT